MAGERTLRVLGTTIGETRKDLQNDKLKVVAREAITATV